MEVGVPRRFELRARIGVRRWGWGKLMVLGSGKLMVLGRLGLCRMVMDRNLRRRLLGKLMGDWRGWLWGSFRGVSALLVVGRVAAGDGVGCIREG